MTNKRKPYAESVNYWKTGQSSPDKWLEKSKREIIAVGGQIHSEMIGVYQGKGVVLLEFTIDTDAFRITYPILESKKGDNLAAKRQAATALYHSVKARCLDVKFLGAKAAFTSFLLLETGQTAGQMASLELRESLPSLLLPSGQ